MEKGKERPRRAEDRHRVHLGVTYRAASEFIREYAENLSSGGLFIRGGSALRVGDEVGVTLELPGFGEYELGAKVAHAIDAEEACEHARSSGVGLRITSSPDGFDDALAAYLERLQQRADAMVFAEDDAFGLLIAAAGYQVKPAPDAGELAGAASDCAVPVIGVVVGSGRREEFSRATIAAGLGDIAISMDAPDDVDRVLVALDRGLSSSAGMLAGR